MKIRLYMTFNQTLLDYTSCHFVRGKHSNEKVSLEDIPIKIE